MQTFAVDKLAQVWKFVRELHPDTEADVGASDGADAKDDEEFEVLFDPRAIDNPQDEVRDRFSFPINSRSRGMYLSLQLKTDQLVAAQALKWEQFLIRCEGELQARGLPKDKFFDLVFERYERDFRVLCEGGIPSEHRSIAWQLLSGTRLQLKQNKNYYTSLLLQHAKEKSDHVIQINKDIPRTFPGHALFDEPDMREMLRRVLIAYSWANKEVGYCQGLNFVAGLLLLFCSEEETFWLLQHITDKIFPYYYSSDMSGVEADMVLLRTFVKKCAPKAYLHMQQLDSDIGLNCLKWLPCLGVGCFPTEVTVRLFDHMFLDGAVILLRVVTSLYRANQDVISNMADGMSLLRTMETAANCAFDPEIVFQVATSLPLSSNDEIYSLRKHTTAEIVAKRSTARTERDAERKAKERARLEEMRRDASLLHTSQVDAEEDENVIDL